MAVASRLFFFGNREERAAAVGAPTARARERASMELMVGDLEGFAYFILGCLEALALVLGIVCVQ